MTIQEIKAAVDSGKTVHWSNTGYVVIKDRCGHYYIKCVSNDSYIGLTWTDGTTLNGKEAEFFLA